MREREPSIFIIEDEISQRLGMQLMLESRGFIVEGAESIADGRRILQNKGESFDVFLVDMRMDKYSDYNENLNITGADLVIKFYEEKAKNGHFQRPEPIVLSAFKEVDLYQKAFHLGAASYLDKAVYSDESVIRHLRALAIKRILSNNIDLVDQIEEIVLKSIDEADIYKYLCSDILANTLSACLGTPFVLFLTEIDLPFQIRATNCENCKNDFPLGEDWIYKEILSLMYRESDTSRPFILNDDNYSLLRTEGSSLSKEQISKFKDASFISIPLAGSFRLTIGILNDDGLYSEPPEEMAKLIISYVNPAAIRFISEIMARWHRSVAERDTTIRKLATFCTNVGNEQLYILEDAKLRNDGDKNLDSQAQHQIKSLAEDLYQTGRLLEPISERNLSTKELKPHSTAAILKDAWREVINEYRLEEQIGFTVEGDCQIQCEREEIFLIAFRLFSWFAGRKSEIPTSDKYSVKIICSETNDDSVVTFEDNSYRIPEYLRAKMFNPFSPVAPSITQVISGKHRPGLYLSLYLSQILVEEKYRGKLRDFSNDLAGNIGHQIEMIIPISKT